MKKFIPNLLFVLSLAAVCIGPHHFASADKDSNYYRPGFVNPNIKYEMYWKDSVNVLQDLDQFSSLYVKYEGCVWSKWGSRYSYYDVDEENDEGGEMEKGCGLGDGNGGESYWYLGRTQCFRANAAFTLYGVLKSDPKSDDEEDGMCRKGTFINSFFTTFGVEAFSGPLGLDTTYANSYCSMQEPNDDESMYYEVYDDDGNGHQEQHNFKNYAAYSSYGTACQNSKFVINKYQGAFCDGADGYLDTTNYLESFNEAIESLECVEIYNANTYNNNNGRRKLNDEYNNYNYVYEVDFEDIESVEILRYSRACSIAQYPIQCPDPFGLLHKYDKAMARALNGTPLTWKSSGEKIINALSAFFLAGAAALAFFACRIKRRFSQKPDVEREPAPAQKVSQSPSTVSRASSAMVASVVSVKEAIEQVFVLRARSRGEQSTNSSKKPKRSRTNSWDWNKKPVMQIVDLDHSITSSSANDESDHSIGSVEIIENTDAGTNSRASSKGETILSWDGKTEIKSSKKKKKKSFLGRLKRMGRR